MFIKRFPKYRIADNRDKDYNIPTLNHKSYTPSEMATLTSKGMPVSTQIYDSFFFDGVTNVGSELLPEDRRGVDVVDAWELSQTANKKLYRAHKSDLNRYGNPDS